MDTLKNILKATVVLFAVGVLVGLALPLAAPLVGMNAGAVALADPPLFLGAFFGLFGAVNAAVAPCADWAINRLKKTAHKTSEIESVPSAFEQHYAQSNDMAFIKKLEQERALAAQRELSR